MDPIKKKLHDKLCDYEEIPDEEWKKVKKEIRTMQVMKKDYFIRANERPDKMAFVVKGIFRVYYLTENGSEVTLVFRDENRFLSAYSSFLENTESRYYFEALEDSLLLYIPIEVYQRLAKGHDCWKTIITKYAQELFIEKEKREVDLLLHDAKEKYMNYLSEHPQICRRVPKRYIASYLGITPETLSRINL